MPAQAAPDPDSYVVTYTIKNATPNKLKLTNLTVDWGGHRAGTPAPPRLPDSDLFRGKMPNEGFIDGVVLNSGQPMSYKQLNNPRGTFPIPTYGPKAELTFSDDDGVAIRLETYVSSGARGIAQIIDANRGYQAVCNVENTKTDCRLTR